jgi:hypothetical protein
VDRHRTRHDAGHLDHGGAAHRDAADRLRLALPDPGSVSALIVERLEDILLGCGLALVGAALAFGQLGGSAGRSRAGEPPRLTAR